MDASGQAGEKAGGDSGGPGENARGKAKGDFSAAASNRRGEIGGAASDRIGGGDKNCDGAEIGEARVDHDYVRAGF